MMVLQKAVSARILRLCGERNISINRLASPFGVAALQHQECPIWEKPEPQAGDHQDDL